MDEDEWLEKSWAWKAVKSDGTSELMSFQRVEVYEEEIAEICGAAHRVPEERAVATCVKEKDHYSNIHFGYYRLRDGTQTSTAWIAEHEERRTL